MREEEDSPAPESRTAEENDAVSDTGQLSDFEFGTIDNRERFDWSHRRSSSKLLA